MKTLQSFYFASCEKEDVVRIYLNWVCMATFMFKFKAFVQVIEGNFNVLSSSANARPEGVCYHVPPQLSVSCYSYDF
uniref:Uncharacterized protein n=1 Tax=Arion vulgaris TaxID=1028688 RepID=A0A0B7ALN0_9EUPU